MTIDFLPRAAIFEIWAREHVWRALRLKSRTPAVHPSVEIYWLHDNAAQDKPQPHKASPMGPWPAALFAFPRFWGEPNKAWQEREAIFPASTTTTGHACGLLRGLQKHESLLTSTYNRSQIIGSMIHVRCSRYLVTHEGSFEYQFHKDGRNMLFSPFSLNGHSPEAWFDSPKRKAKGQGLRPVSIIGKGKV